MATVSRPTQVVLPAQKAALWLSRTALLAPGRAARTEPAPAVP